ncbi:hypothetical protein [Jiangella mangrovi]|uniref:Uncharacterized protein n=1 Tax=Jiangella mangrovi TaxID=1524084 RepID=A0A7W9GR77_9ACTN|nr:hypothetical protein [Jiangella mangrovi]MBB5788539.1 hypothetical protein [Jiangella mangrovi]
MTSTAPATTPTPAAGGPRVRRPGRLFRTAVHRLTSFVLPPGGTLAQTLTGPPAERPNAEQPALRLHLNAPMLDVRPLGRWLP